MPKREASLLVDDMLAAIEKIGRYIAGSDQQGFLGDEKTRDAVVRNLEIIGEAARQMPDSFKESHPKIPWYEVSGLRNRIVHDYAGVDFELIWQICITDLPLLKEKLNQLDT